jgi:hypothetical protein
VVDPASFRTSEFNRSYHLGAIGAEYAYAKGLTGAGVTIGILDFNFDFSSGELTYASGSAGINQAYIDMYEAQTGEESSDEPHGHAVAVFAAGARNAVDTHGVAYDAKILAVDYFSGVNLKQVQQGGITYYVSNPYTYMTNRGARVINISIGYDEDDIISNPPPVSQRYVLDSPLYALDQGAVLVAAAGNSGEPEPMLSNLDIMDDAVSEGLLNNSTGAFIIVGSVDKNNVISDFSDRAGRAMNIFLVAPGEEVVFPFRNQNGPGLFIGSGTSFSAPQVSGAAAILYQRWPQLSGQAIADILFNSATDLGTAGTDPVYGRGALNLEAAVEPAGTISTAISGSSTTTPLEQLGMILGPAFGDARPYPLNRVMGLDAYGRDYYYDLRGLVIDHSALGSNLIDVMDNYLIRSFASTHFGSATASVYAIRNQAPPSVIESLIQSPEETSYGNQVTAFSLRGSTLGWNWQIGRGVNLAALLDGGRDHHVSQLPSMHKTGFMNTAGSFMMAGYEYSRESQLAVGIVMDSNDGLDSHPNPNLRARRDRVISVAQLSRSFQKADLSIQLGSMFEEEAVLGSRGVGGFGIADRATTRFLSLDGYFQLTPSIGMTGHIESGMTSVAMTQEATFFAPMDDFITTSWSVNLSGRDPVAGMSTWVIGVTQPLRAENANVTAAVATRVDPVSAKPVFESLRFPLTPSGRELAVEAAWRYQHDDWMIVANIARRFDAGHVAGRTDSSALILFKSRF